MKVTSLPQKSIHDYRKIIGSEKIEEILEKAEEIKGTSITHVNSTSFGGGVAEILYSMVPLMNSVGLKTIWEVIRGDEEFFNITKKIHNSLQGAPITLTEAEKKKYLEVNRWNAEEELELSTDTVIIHDPQPLGVRKYRDEPHKWIWRCHIDLSTPNKDTWIFIAGLLHGYDASIYHLKEYIHPETPTPHKFVMPPSIDPLSDKNRELPESQIHRILERYGVDPEKPILIQVARFDPWKDPFAAIDTYRLVKEKIPGTQLLLVASMATDDPEGWIYYEKTLRYAGMDEDIFILTNLKGVGPIEVNAFQRAATIALQMSTREGFGLAVAEAMWKKTPVIARPRGGIKIQVIDGVTGYHVETPQEAAQKAIHLIKHPEKRKQLGENAHQHVKNNFIITKHLENYLNIISKLLK